MQQLTALWIVLLRALIVVWLGIAIIPGPVAAKDLQEWVVRHQTRSGFVVTGEASYSPETSTMTLKYRADKTPWDGMDLGTFDGGTVFGASAKPMVRTYKSTDVTIKKDNLRVVFTGPDASPIFDDDYLGPALPEYDINDWDAEMRAMEELERRQKEAFRIWDETARFEITLTRKLSDARSFEGNWRFEVGVFEKPRTGREVWTVKPGKIIDVIVLADQTGRNELGQPLFPYPFGDNPEATTRGSTTRRLFVVGVGLPDRAGQATSLSSEEPLVQYRLDAVQSDAAEFGTVAEEFKKGWAKFARRSGGQSPEGLNAVVLVAKLKPKVLPGPTKFTLSGSKAVWKLEFGDATGQLSFTRKRGVPKITRTKKRKWNATRRKWITTNQTQERVETDEVTAVAYIYDEIRVQLELANSFPIDTFEAELGPPATVQIDLKRADLGPASSASPNVTLRRDKENPRLYRSDTLYIVEREDAGQDRPTGPEGIILRVNTPSRLIGKVPDDRITLQPGFGSLQLATTPDEIGGSFTQALKRAASCYKNVPDVDWDRLTNQTATNVSNVLVVELATRSVRLTFGDHAAMLLLRDEFLRGMASARREFSVIANSDRLTLGLVRGIDPVFMSKKNPLYRMPVPNPEDLSKTMEFGYFLLVNDDLRPPQLVRPARTAIRQFIKAIDKSAAFARQLNTCNVEGLLTLTGRAFDAVVRGLEPKLMRARFNKTRGRIEIEPDVLGRAAVRGLASTASAIRAQRAYSSIDTDLVVGVAAAILSGGASAVLGEGLVALAAAFAVDIAASSISGIASWSDYEKSQKELQFALGASAVLGTDRLDTAELEAVDWYDAVLATYLEVVGVAAGVASDAVTAIKAARTAKLVDMVTRGQKIAGSMAVDGARKLSVTEVADLGAYLSHAKNLALKEGPSALSSVQRNALDAMGEPRRAVAALEEFSGQPGANLGRKPPAVPPAGDFGGLSSSSDGLISGLPGSGNLSSVGELGDLGGTLRNPGLDLPETVNLPPRGAGPDLAGTAILPAPPRGAGPDLTETAILPAPLRGAGPDLAGTAILPAPPRGAGPDLAGTAILPAPPRGAGPDLAGTAILPAPPRGAGPDLAGTAILPAPPRGAGPDLAGTTILPAPPRGAGLDLTETAILPAPPRGAGPDLAGTAILPAPPRGAGLDLNRTANLPANVRPPRRANPNPIATAPPPTIGATPAPPRRLGDGEVANTAIELKGPSGSANRAQIGKPLAAGTYNDVYTVPGESDSIYRVSKVGVDDPDVQLDDMGWSAFSELDASLVRTPQIKGTFTSNIGGGPRRVRKLEFFDKTAARQVADNPSPYQGVMTPEQAIAFDTATREMNKKGFVWLDNHTNNYAFEAIPGQDGKLRVVVTDPGGIVKVKGPDPAGTARRIQMEINSPPPEFVKKVTAEGANVDIQREVRRENLIEANAAALDLPSAMKNPVESFLFRTDQNAQFEKVRELFRKDGTNIKAAYRALLAQ